LCLTLFVEPEALVICSGSWYTDDCQTPTEMAKLDLEQDVVAMLEGEDTVISAVEVKP
jgi:hypothetical protein